MDLNDKVAVVTGASSGLGRRFALDLAGGGAVVVGLARRSEPLQLLEKEMKASSPDSMTTVCDVSDVEAFRRVLADIERTRSRIDILVNNAGINEIVAAPDDLGLFRRVMETNYFAAVAGTLAVLPGMRDRGSGVVVNVSSDSARVPGPREFAYGPSKAALTAFTESMAWRMHGTGVYVHALYPGWVPTAMGSGVVDAGLPTPPRMVRRTEEQVSKVLLAKMGKDQVDIDATTVARFAPIAKVLFPGMYSRSVRKAMGSVAG